MKGFYGKKVIQINIFIYLKQYNKHFYKNKMKKKNVTKDFFLSSGT